MSRFFRQFLAIFAVLVSTGNAQCALLCSLQPPVSESRAEAHPCCPAPHGQAPRPQSGQHPCPAPSICGNVSTGNPQWTASPDCLDLAFATPVSALPDPPGQTLPALESSFRPTARQPFSVLRI